MGHVSHLFAATLQESSLMKGAVILALFRISNQTYYPCYRRNHGASFSAFSDTSSGHRHALFHAYLNAYNSHEDIVLSPEWVHRCRNQDIMCIVRNS